MDKAQHVCQRRRLTAVAGLLGKSCMHVRCTEAAQANHVCPSFSLSLHVLLECHFKINESFSEVEVFLLSTF